MVKKRYIAAAVLTASVFYGAGVVVGDGGGTVEAQQPTPTMTVTAPAGPAERVDVTPQSCLDALDAADLLDATQVSSLSAAEDGFTAVAEQDPDALDATVARLAGLAAPMRERTAAFAAAEEQCRAASGADL